MLAIFPTWYYRRQQQCLSRLPLLCVHVSMSLNTHPIAPRIHHATSHIACRPPVPKGATASVPPRRPHSQHQQHQIQSRLSSRLLLRERGSPRGSAPRSSHGPQHPAATAAAAAPLVLPRSREKGDRARLAPSTRSSSAGGRSRRSRRRSAFRVLLAVKRTVPRLSRRPHTICFRTGSKSSRRETQERNMRRETGGLFSVLGARRIA